MRHTVSRLSLLAIVASLGACAALPRSGPDDSTIAKQATARNVSATASTATRTVGIDYALVDINAQVLSYVGIGETRSLRGGFGAGRGPAPEITVGVGDTIDISIFEAAAGGLFIPVDAGSRPGNFVNLPAQRVDSSGEISVPYAGKIPVVGRQPAQIGAEIEQRLANRAVEPQAIVTVSQSESSSVAVLGDVQEPAKFALNPAGERVLDVISRAGGLSTPGIETYVTLRRGSRQATVLFDDLIERPEENIYVRPGDTIYVDRERRTFLAFGATGLNGRIDFEEAGLTLGEAMAKAGGLLDSRADPAQVFLYRTVDRHTLHKMGVDVTKFTSSAVPTVFRANMRDPAALFAIQKFPMQDKDALYVSNSDSTELSKLLNIINEITGTTANTAENALSTRDSLRDLTD